jgi:threonyl-tRNA synthetase
VTGSALWLPKGAALRKIRTILEKAQKKVMSKSPTHWSEELYVTSGHYAKYGADSFQPITTPHEGEEFY